MHPVAIDQGVASVSFAHESGRAVFGTEDETRLREFVAAYTAQGRGPISVTVEGTSLNDRIALARSLAFKDRIVDGGVPPRRVNRYMAPRKSANRGRTITVLSYEKYIVRLPTCGDWSKDVSYNPRNELHSNFGCATQSYRGMQAADPADLVRARPSGDHDNYRLRDVFNRYREGKSTPSEQTGGEQQIQRITTQ
jgi:pilus assembly protein CpaD